MAGLRQGDAETLGLRREKAVRDLHQDAAAVAHLRVGADRAAMVEVLQDLEALLDDGVGLAVVHVGDEADAAGILLVARVVEALARRQGRIAHDEGGNGLPAGGVLGPDPGPRLIRAAHGLVSH